MVDLLIEHGTLLTMDPGRRTIYDGAVAISGDSIVAVGTTEELKEYDTKQVIDASKKVVMPGLIDTHGHQGGLIKAVGEHSHVIHWANMRWFVESRVMTEEAFYTEGLLSAVERLKFGTTCGVTLFHRVDDPVFASKNAEAIKTVGIRGVISIGPMHPPWPKKFSTWGEGRRADRTVELDEALTTCERTIEAWNNEAEGRIMVWLLTERLAPNKPECTGKVVELYDDIRRIADKYGTGMNTHAYCGDVKFAYEKLNVLGPKMLLVHATGLLDEEINILAKTDTRVSHCPAVVGFCGTPFMGTPGIARIPEMINAGVAVGLGSDGPTGRITSFDMFKEMKFAMALQRLRFESRWYMPPGKAIEMATIDAARALGIDKLTGSIEVGKKADIILLDMFKPHLVPFYMASHRVAYEAMGSDVNTVIVDGKVLMENREVKTVDEEELLERAQLEAEETIERGGLEPLMKMEQREEFWRLSKY